MATETITPAETARQIAQQFSGPLQPRQLLELAQQIEAAIAEAIDQAADTIGDRAETEIKGYRRTLLSILRMLLLADTTNTTFDGDALIALIRQRLGAPRDDESQPLRLDP